MPFVSPLTTHEVAGAVIVQVLALSSTVVTVYEAGVPPVPLSVTVTVAWPLPATAVGVLGIAGAPGLTDADTEDALEVPLPFVAVAVKVYALPSVSPDTAQDVAGGVTVHVAPPGAAVTVYEVGVPPLPADTVTVTSPLPGPTDAVGVPGVPGGGCGVTAVEAEDEPDVPLVFVAVAVKV